MVMNVDITRNDTYIYVKFTGDYEFKEVTPLESRVLQACKENKCSYVLFDTTELNMKLSTLDRYEIGKYLSTNLRLPEVQRIASVGLPEHIDGFSSIVAENRGVQFKAFTDKDTALDWLFKKG